MFTLFIEFLFKDNIDTNKNNINLFDFDFPIKQFKMIFFYYAIASIKQFAFDKRFSFFFKLLLIKDLRLIRVLVCAINIVALNMLLLRIA